MGSDGSVIHVTRLPELLLFVVGGLSMYLGAAAAVWLFGVVDPAAVAWLRQLGAAVVLLAWRRPGRAVWHGKIFWLAALFGLVTAAMNLVFYESIDRLPLGTAVALEFVGPVLVAAWGSRSVRDSGALLLVVSGVALIADVRWVGSTLGVVFALSAAVLWAGYIVLGKRIAGEGLGVDGLAVGFGVATVALSPLALGTGPVDLAAAPGRRPRRPADAGYGGAVRARPGRAAAHGTGAVRPAAGVTPRHGHGGRASGATAGADAAGGVGHSGRGHGSHDSDARCRAVSSPAPAIREQSSSDRNRGHDSPSGK